MQSAVVSGLLQTRTPRQPPVLRARRVRQPLSLDGPWERGPTGTLSSACDVVLETFPYLSGVSLYNWRGSNNGHALAWRAGPTPVGMFGSGASRRLRTEHPRTGTSPRVR